MVGKTTAISCIVALALQAEVFELGKIEVNASSQQGKASDGSVVTIDKDELEAREIKRLSEIATSTAGLYVDKKGARGEKNFTVRGFDARHVPLFIDGIPVYVPYDGNTDFNRFITFDLSRIEVSKGASSVLYGMNTMGGAINLISRKPSREFEGNIGYGFETGRSSDTLGNNLELNLGTRQEKFYTQIGGSFFEDKGEQLSKDFKEGALANNEDGGRRESSLQRDSKVSAKVGFTPNASDEYTIAYTRADGRKEVPNYAGRYTSAQFRNATRYWDWPNWDRESLYWLSYTRFHDFYLKTKAFRDAYENSLRSYKDKYRTKLANSNPISYYDDLSYGLGVELGTDLKNHALKVAFGYKFDRHNERDDGEPRQTSEDKSHSIGLEDTIRLNENSTLVLGASYDAREALKAQDYAVVGKSGGKNIYKMVDFDVNKRDAFNYQLALNHQFDNSSEGRISYAKKSYFPSMKDRYSTRFQRNIPNPFLNPEIAEHFEIGYAKTFTDSLRVDSSLFYSRVKDTINNVGTGLFYGSGSNKHEIQQARNMNKATYSGIELSALYAVGDFELNANYAYIHAKIQDNGQNIIVEDLPKHKGYLQATYRASSRLSFNIAQELQSSFNSANSSLMTKLGGFGVTHAKVSFAPANSLRLETGIRNIFDRNYEYREGYPEEGRVFFGNLRYKF